MKEFFEDIREAIVVGILFSVWAMAIFLIPIEVVSSVVHLSYNTTLWMHKLVLLAVFFFVVIAGLLNRKTYIQSITIIGTCE